MEPIVMQRTPPASFDTYKQSKIINTLQPFAEVEFEGSLFEQKMTITPKLELTPSDLISIGEIIANIK